MSLKVSPTGLAEDPRPKKEQAKDWSAFELAGDSVLEKLNWQEKKKRDTKKYIERNQLFTSSCVAQSLAKAFEVAEKHETGKEIAFSATPIYAPRANRPGEGMWLENALSIAVNQSTTYESRIKSQFFKTDKEMEKEILNWNSGGVSDDDIAETHRPAYYTNKLEDRNIDFLAAQTEHGRSPIIIIYATQEEWSKEFPVIIDKNLKLQNAFVRHAVAIVDYLLIKGKKYLKIEDSAHFGGLSERYISEEFLMARCYGVGILFDRSNLETDKPAHNFTKVLTFGMRKDPDVMKLQDVLRYEGFFPDMPSTGNYFEITRQGVEKFQNKYKVASLMELLSVKGNKVGKKTLGKLNELYGK